MMVVRWLVTAMLVVGGALIGCGEAQPPTPYNYNLGSEPGELMPTPPPAADQGILEERIAVRPSPAPAPAESEDTEVAPLEEPVEP